MGRDKLFERRDKAHGGDGVMVWAGISYLNAEIRPMVAMGLWYGQG
jgi:hypothetical protein